MRGVRTLVLALALVAAVSVSAQAAATITFWTMSLTPQFTDYIEGLVRTYEAENPGVKVVWRDIPYNTLQQQFLAAVAAGNPPDVVNLPSAWTVAMAERNALLSMDEVLTPEEQADYYPGILNSTLYNGKIYGVPWYVAPDMMFINTEIFQRAGLDPNNPPKTWDDAIEYARIIKERTGIYGFEPNFILPDMLLREGIELVTFGPDGPKVAFNTPEAVAEVQRWVKVYNDGLVPPDVVTGVRSAELDAVKRFSAGQLGMLITGAQFVLRVKEESPAVYQVTKAVPLPVGRAGTTRASVQSLVIPRGTKNAREAAKFLMFVTNTANFVEFATRTTIFPGRISVAESPYFTEPDGTLEGEARLIGARLLPLVDATPLNLPNSQQRTDAMDNAMTLALQGKLSPAEAIAQAAAAWEQLIK